jgi:DNA-binding response OmpR family regulator
MGVSRTARIHARFRALLIEADEAYRAAMAACTRIADCEVHEASDIGFALTALDRSRFDVVVWGVPAIATDRRREAIGELRLRTQAPLVLVAAGFETAQTDLEAGADHWLPKPFVPGALVGAVRAALRRSPFSPIPVAITYELRGMLFNGDVRTLSFEGSEAWFTRQEWELILILADHPNRFLTAREILSLGWHAGAYGPEEVRIYMRRLRRKMEPLRLPCELLSKHGSGYCLKLAA